MKTLNGGQTLTIPCKIGDYCLFDTGLCIKKMRVRGFYFGYSDLGFAIPDCEKCTDSGCFVQKPPQSWCFVEELQ